jgi:DNA-binding MarR family transcriptional regulator
MATSPDDAAKIWSLNYRVLLSVISSVDADITALGLDSKELFLLAEVDDHPYPAELAATMSMPKATVTVYLKRLEAAGFLRRHIDPTDLRRHRLESTPKGRRVIAAGLSHLSAAFAKRLERLTKAQQKELGILLERIV